MEERASKSGEEEKDGRPEEEKEHMEELVVSCMLKEGQVGNWPKVSKGRGGIAIGLS